MRIVSGSDMKRLDDWAISKKGIPVLILMENAGMAIVERIKEIYSKIEGLRLVILVGKGNNGGDALVAARHLHQLGGEVKLFLLSSPANLEGPALVNWQIIEQLAIKWQVLDNENSFYLLKLSLANCNLALDGLFGTGLKGEFTEYCQRTIKITNESGCPILAIDVPSGLNADTGQVKNPCIKATYTVSFAWAKRGLFLFPGKSYVGDLVIAPIAIPQEGLTILETKEYCILKKDAQQLLPQIDWEGHKNTYGHLLVIAGSQGMMGAAILASRAGFRAGSGLVTACVPRTGAGLFNIALPEAITRGVSETPERTLSKTAWAEIKKLLPQKKAVVFGPGLTTHADIQDLLAELVLELNVPLVIDADGLNVLAQDLSILKNAKAPLILTPHPKEMARLLNLSVEEVQENRVKTAIRAASLLKAIIVLKGAGTVIASPEGDVYINSTGSPALATAGTGDVLTGTIGGFLAQGLKPLQAALLGVYVHGLAGDLVALEKGYRGVLASDVVETLPLAINQLNKEKE